MLSLALHFIYTMFLVLSLALHFIHTTFLLSQPLSD